MTSFIAAFVILLLFFLLMSDWLSHQAQSR